MALCLMILAMTSSAFTACGNEPVNTPSGETGNTAETTMETEAVDPRQMIDDNLPEKDLGGAVFKILADSHIVGWLYVDEMNGDVVDDAIYQRNSVVSERFNVNLEFIGDNDYQGTSKIVTQTIQAGDDEFDLICTHVVETGKLAMNDFYVNWKDIPYVDFSKPWWARATTDDLTYNNVCVLAVGDMVVNALANTYCMFYNKNLAEDYDMPDIYKIVNDGKWTLDKMMELTKDIWQDMDNDGKRSDGDFYGMTTDGRSNMVTYYWSLCNKIISPDASGALVVDYYNEKTINAVQKLCSLFFDDQGLYIGDGWSYGMDTFMERRSVFANGRIDHGNRLRDMDDDYGIIPYPKWDEAQANYATMVDGAHGVLVVPITNGDLDTVGLITEAMNAESYKRIIPVYYDITLKDKGARDEESIALLDKIVDSRVFDLGYVYDGWSGASFFFQDLISKNDSNLASYWTKKEKAVTKQYQKVIDFFTNYNQQ